MEGIVNSAADAFFTDGGQDASALQRDERLGMDIGKEKRDLVSLSVFMLFAEDADCRGVDHQDMAHRSQAGGGAFPSSRV